jgi:hypothetical protein
MRIHSYFVSTILALGVASAAPSGLRAQRLDPSGQMRIGAGIPERPFPAQALEQQFSAPRGIAGGVLAGSLGLGIGLIGGANLSSGPRCPGEDCGIVGAIVGATIGESIGLALGTHYAGRGRGSPLATTLATTAIGAAGMAAAFAAEGAAPYIIGITPIIQSAVIIAMER